jgi:hypothetical protein
LEFLDGATPRARQPGQQGLLARRGRGSRRRHGRAYARLVTLVVTGVVALVAAGSALAANAQGLPRAGYCLHGKFLNLVLGQPSADPMYEDAVLAWYVKGVGITCAAPPAGYVAFETAPDEFGVPGRLYAYWVPAGSN